MSLLPLGAGILVIIASNNSFIPSPVLALVKMISSSPNPKLVSSSVTLGISELGKSILLITGIIVKLLSRAR